jgi:2-polyprenyl-6-methoxyphenol hydroxylase-like FAD-dependent oxidoreductase
MPESPAAVFERLSDPQQPEPGNAQIRCDKAVVLGGSIAGLLAARVLADHANSVVIIERDESGADETQVESIAGGAGDTARAGVPQGLQVHTLLPGGRAQLERWFPGLTREAQEGGAVESGPDGVAAYTDDTRQVPTENSVLLTASRPYMEALIRRETLALHNVRTVVGHATGLVYEDGAVTGARYRTAGGERVESSDFLVDAMGRASRLPDWLEQDDWERPELERMEIDINYATAFFKRAENEPVIGAAIARYGPRLAHKPLAALNAVEDGQWMLMLAGYGDDRPGSTEADFLARCAELPPVFAEAVHGRLIGGIRTYHQADSRRHHFSRLRLLPARLVSVGDAVASFNPIYGQGMSSAALHASCLSEYLRTDPDLAAPARRFFALQQVVVDAAWQISTSADASRLGGTRNPSAKGRFERWVDGQILAAAGIDEKIATSFNAVTYMTVHPASLRTPGNALRAVGVNRRARKPHQAGRHRAA